MRARELTRHFDSLQGLAGVPGVLCAALVTAWFLDVVPGWWVLAAVPVAALLTYLAVRHYGRRYGRVSPRRTPSTWTDWLAGAAGVASGIAGAAWVDLPVAVGGVVLATTAALGALRIRPLAPALVTVGGVGVVVSLLPLGGPGAPHPLNGLEPTVLAGCAGAVVVLVWAHVVLRRSFTPVPA